MRAYDCPPCGGKVAFQSSITIFATCPYCGNMVIRRDMDLESLGNQAALPPDLSPLQIGTTGLFDGQPFTLVGRVRVGYREGTWNEWCADFGGGRWGWIAEAQGFYMATFELQVPEGFPGTERMASETKTPGGLTLIGQGLSIGRDSLPLGKRVDVYGTEYQVRDVKQTEVLGSEGELSFVAAPGRSAISADMGAPGLRFANAEYSEAGLRLFVGRYCHFEDLKFDNLRLVPGWTTEEIEPTRNQSAALSCPQCGAAVVLRAGGWSKSAVCTHCQGVIDTSNPVWHMIEGAISRNYLKPKIPIGSRGTMEDVTYECIGCMVRSDGAGDRWLEYLLFNPFHGFRWLVNYESHWNWVTVLLEPPSFDGMRPVHDGQSFALFSKGRAEVADVLGEFYWKVRRRERTEVQDYVAVPWVLSKETYPDLAEETWSLGKYIPAQEIYSAFKLPGSPPEVSGVYVNQPNPYKEKTSRVLVPAVAAVAVLCLIQLIACFTGSERDPVFKTQVDFDVSRTNQLAVTAEFEIKGSHPGPVRIETGAAVSNAWVDISTALVNSATKEAWEIESEVSYYSGFDDGFWSEGSQRDSHLVSMVPPGKYFLRIDMAADHSVKRLPVHIAVVPGGTVWASFFLGILAIAAYPGWVWLRGALFESSRWENSYTPASSVTGDTAAAEVSLASLIADDDD